MTKTYQTGLIVLAVLMSTYILFSQASASLTSPMNDVVVSKGGGNGNGGNGPGDGTGNGGDGPKDGTGNGSNNGDCDIQSSLPDSGWMFAGKGKGYGPGDGSGNGGNGPKDGSGNGPGTGTCPNS